MLAQTPNLPPPLQRIATTPVLASEKPLGFPHVKVTRLAPNRRIHTLGGVRLDFSNSHTSESASFALMRTRAAARRLAHTEATVKTGGLFHTRAVAVGRFAVGVAARTKAQAKTLLALALSHLRRSEREHLPLRPEPAAQEPFRNTGTGERVQPFKGLFRSA